MQKDSSKTQPITKIEELDRPEFPGSRSKWIETLTFVQPELYDGIPVYRLTSRDGKILNPDEDPKVIKGLRFKTG